MLHGTEKLKTKSSERNERWLMSCRGLLKAVDNDDSLVKPQLVTNNFQYTRYILDWKLKVLTRLKKYSF